MFGTYLRTILSTSDTHDAQWINVTSFHMYIFEAHRQAAIFGIISETCIMPLRWQIDLITLAVFGT